MPIQYSFVSREKVLLADYTPFSGNFDEVGLECVEKMPKPPPSKFTVVVDGHTFNFLFKDSFYFLAVADEKYGRAMPFAFLQRVKDEFEEKHIADGKKAQKGQLQEIFKARIRNHMEYVTEHPEEISKIVAVQKRIKDVKDVMKANIEKVKERGDKLDTLNDKVNEMAAQAEMFNKKTKALKDKMFWQRCKIFVFIGIAVVVLIGVVVAVIVVLKKM